MDICERGFEAMLYPCILTDWPLSPAGYGERYIRGTSIYGPGPDGKKKLLYRGDYERAHVVALEAKLGRPLRPGMKTLHHCDVRACIQPRHLYEGTQRQNVQDMHDRKRFKSPFTTGNQYNEVRKALTPDQEAQVCQRYSAGRISQVALASEYGVSQPVISRAIVRGGASRTNWSHPGRAPELSDAVQREISRRYEAEDISQKALAEEFRVSQATVARTLRRVKEADRAQVLAG